VSGVGRDVTGFYVLVFALACASVFGLVWKRRDGRVRASAPASGAVDRDSVDPDVLASLGVTPGGEVTLLQFSSAFCAPCRTTRVVLAAVARETPGVRHVEVDAESNLDAVRALGILRTPTTLVLDGAGRVRGRASGAPRKSDVVATLDALLAKPSQDPRVPHDPPGKV
jgi:thiol-disulfide isomerase/thioredoxin